jgi:hypothetical protein
MTEAQLISVMAEQVTAGQNKLSQGFSTSILGPRSGSACLLKPYKKVLQSLPVT